MFSRQELLIPIQPGMQIKVASPESDDSLVRREEQRREQATKMLAEHIGEINMASKFADFSAEARFYLSENNFDYRKAVEAYDKDLIFEQKMLKNESNKVK